MPSTAPSVRFSEEVVRSSSPASGSVSVSATPRRLSLVASSEGYGDAPSSRQSEDKFEALSLSLNYLPAKFSSPPSRSPTPQAQVQTHLRRRNSRNRPNIISFPGILIKPGGGRNAFKSNEARMPALNESEDEDEKEKEKEKEEQESNESGFSRKKLPALRWTRFKWVLLFSNIVFVGYSFLGLVCCLLTWFNVWENADVIRVANRPELIQSTFAAFVAVITSILGLSGLFLNNRPFLAMYSFLCWIAFAALVIPGYITYKRRSFDLQGKLSLQWSRDFDLDARLRIQNELECCGYFSPFVESAVSQWCYSRSQFPGCAGPFLSFEQKALEIWYIVVFSLVPVQLGIMIAGLLCSNHVTYRFGKGMMPQPYRLSLTTMAIMMEKYASELASQYCLDSDTPPLQISLLTNNPTERTNLVTSLGTPGSVKRNSMPSMVAVSLDLTRAVSDSPQAINHGSDER